jgi:hypothetical protein
MAVEVMRNECSMWKILKPSERICKVAWNGKNPMLSCWIMNLRMGEPVQCQEVLKGEITVTFGLSKEAQPRGLLV